MAVLESAAAKAGGVVVTRALAARAAEQDRGKDLVDLIRVGFPDQIKRRGAKAQLKALSEAVTRRLLDVCAHEFRGVPEGDQAVVLEAVAATLTSADLSNDAMFAADVDAAKLLRRIRTAPPSGLSDAGRQLYRRALEACCESLLRIVRQLPQFVPAAEAEILSRLTEITTLLTAQPTEAAEDEAFRRRYFQFVAGKLGTLELIGIPGRFSPKTTLSVAYISLSVSMASRSTRRRGIDPIQISDWRGDTEEPDQTAVQVEKALAGSRLTVIRGEAGAGKSTLLRWLAVTAARDAFEADLADWNSCVPFLIKLRDYPDGDLPAPEHFLDKIAKPIVGRMPDNWVLRQLESGRAVLLVDGVDELVEKRRRHVRSWLRELLSAYPQIRVVVTSRPSAVTSKWLEGDGFQPAFLEPLNPKGIRALIHQWHEAMADAGDSLWTREQLSDFEQRLRSELRAKAHLYKLASTPLLSAMLCALNLDRNTKLPDGRMDLYRAVLDMLLLHRDSEREIPSYEEIVLEQQQKEHLLRILAYKLAEDGRSELSRYTAECMIQSEIANMLRISSPAEAVLKHLLVRSGVLREPADDQIDFVHRTVQEYLAAAKLVDDGDFAKLVSHAHLDQWRETIIMAAGYARGEFQVRLLRGLLDRIRKESGVARRLKLLLAACQETLLTIPTDLKPDIEQCWAELVPPRTMPAARSLATAGTPVLDRLPRTLEGLSEAAAKATVRAVRLINGPRALDLLARYAGDPRWQVQRELAEGWGSFEPHRYASLVLARCPANVQRLFVRTHEQYAALRHIPELRDLDLSLEPLPDLMELADRAENLTGLTIEAGLTDLGFVRALPPLRRLDLRQLAQVTDFAPLATQTKLTSLWLTGCPALSDVEVLPLDGLEVLCLDGSSLRCNLAHFVEKIPNVWYFYPHQSDWIDDIEPLTGLALRGLSLADSAVKDLGPLAGQSRLNYFELQRTPVNDLAALAGLCELETLNLWGCLDVHDLGPLADLPRLRKLHIGGTAPGVDLAPLAENRRLTVTIDRGQEVRNQELLGRRVKVLG